MAQTVVGLYDYISQARATVQDLVNSGFERNDINFVANASAEEYVRYFDFTDPALAGMGWDATEAEAERRWTERGEGPWTDYRDAVRYGYEQGHGGRNHA